MNITKAYNFIQIDKRVSSSGTIMDVNLQSLADASYDVVINLLPDDNEHAVKNEGESFKTLGISYTYIPIDWEAPTRVNFKAFEAAMIAAKGKKIHIHCAANYRAIGFYAIYAYKHLAWSTDKMDEFIEKVWKISKYPVWVKLVAELINDL